MANAKMNNISAKNLLVLDDKGIAPGLRSFRSKTRSALQGRLESPRILQTAAGKSGK